MEELSDTHNKFEELEKMYSELKALHAQVIQQIGESNAPSLFNQNISAIENYREQSFSDKGNLGDKLEGS